MGNSLRPLGSQPRKGNRTIVKNVIAIASGIADGVGFGANTKATLITRGLGEGRKIDEILAGMRQVAEGVNASTRVRMSPT